MNYQDQQFVMIKSGEMKVRMGERESAGKQKAGFCSFMGHGTYAGNL